MIKVEKIRLGEALVKEGLITTLQLENALAVQKTSNRKLGKILIELKYVTEEQIAISLSKLLQVQYLKLKNYNIDVEVVNLLSEYQARKFKAIPIKKNNQIIELAMSDPLDLMAYDELQKILKKEIKVICITEEDLFFAIDKYYSNKENLSNLAEELEKDIFINTENLNQGLTVEEAPVIKLLYGVFEDAIKNGASDIHIEPQKEKTMIRFRIDGELILHTEVNNKICAPLISRLKIVSNLDISEKRLPQDGRFNLEIHHKSVDVRLSILPGYYGEVAVMRLLRQDTNFINIANLNMSKEMFQSYLNMIESPEGMVLVVGPTGSGKTTTLYSSLSHINTINKKIITIEDPVEYQLPMLNQINVNEKIDLTFEKILRSVLRQDPDIIMVGEIRDTITAQIALRGAVTGHLIFSTLHTKDSVSTPIRLIDMGIAPYMVASALQGVLSQRLIRRNCPECTIEHELTEKEKIWVEKDLELNYHHVHWKKGMGCSYCNHTGFFGRVPVYELLVMDDELTRLLYKSDFSEYYKAASNKIHNHSMKNGLIELLKAGNVCIDEVKKMRLI